MSAAPLRRGAALAPHPLPRRGGAPVPAGTPTRPRLKVVAAPALLTRSQRPRLPFVLLLVTLLAAGLIGLLLLNTVVAQDAFALHRLQAEQTRLDDDEATLRMRAEQLDDPGALAARARALGMVAGGDPSFVQSGRPFGAVPPGVRSLVEAQGTRVGGLLVVGSAAPATAAPPAPAPASPLPPSGKP